MRTDPMSTATDIASDYFKMNIKQRLNFVMNLTALPSITVMIFLRRKIGYRMLKPAKFVGMAIFLSAFPYVLPYIPFIGVHSSPNESHLPIVIFAVIMAAFGLWQRRQRWQSYKRGELWHSYSEGISRLSFLPLRETLCNRFVDPFICLVVGLTVLVSVSSFLGGYLIFSGLCLLHYEQALYELRIDNMLDTLDGFCDAEAQSQHIAFFSGEVGGTGGESKPATLSIEETAGIPTGLAPDIEAQIQKRRARKPPPDDLAINSDG